jgi:DNA mismatch repair protein MutS
MAEKKATETPMMKQFFELKAKHPDAVLLFRCGDFYETYAQDAVEASQILGITLTKRNNGNQTKSLEMAGFPHHALDTYLPKLIRAGRRVAICDQLEDPKLAKKLVKRGVTELVTPGVAIGDNVLTGKENNFLAAVHIAKGACGVAFLDISTGEFLTSQGQCDYIEKLLANFMPKEVLIKRDTKKNFQQIFGSKYFLQELDDWVFTEDFATDKLHRHFKVKSLKGFGVDHLRTGIIACGAVLKYLEETLHNNIGHIATISRIEEDKYVRLDSFTIRNLELVHSSNEDGKSLLQIIDKTSSPMGARLLRRWLLFPLKDAKAINARLDVVDTMFRNPQIEEELKEYLCQIGDLERLVSKAAVLRINPREMVSLNMALRCIDPIKEICGSLQESGLSVLAEKLQSCSELCEKIEHTIRQNPPMLLNKGGVIADGVDEELDRLRNISYSGKDYLLQIQNRESEETGIPNLKIAFNNVFGYYIEVRNTYKDKVPERWIRKQTLVNAERYITEELKQYEEQILTAEDKILAIENRIYGEMVQSILPYIKDIQTDASVLAQLDCLVSFATLARENNYIRPVVDDSLALDICEGRHPVIEKQLPLGEEYVSNNLYVDTSKEQILIITGPNMAGKSALLRQTALITIMAQMGSYVPATSAHIGIVDKVFTRVGASDNISAGESTFMVEMTEASNILNNLSLRSLVLFDELGRGTSTYDGISIAWAIVEHIHEHHSAHARTLFATHYHELNEMASTFSRIRNYNVAVKEVDGKVLFLRKLKPGGSEHSFGIHVAEMAGMPRSIVKRAEVILSEMETGSDGKNISRPTAETGKSREGMQMSFFQLEDPVLCQIRDQLLQTDVNNLTPIEALNKLNDIKKILKGK